MKSRMCVERRLRGIGAGVAILIKSIKAAPIIQRGQDRRAMPAAAKRSVHVDTIGYYVEELY
jgi:hypothetical protein